MPVGWFPGAVPSTPAGKQLCVANIKGHAVERIAMRRRAPRVQLPPLLRLRVLVPLPKRSDLPRLSQTVYDNYRRDQIELALEKPRPGQPPRPVPERIGEPSPIKHVVYVIKENRTYDQVFGAIPGANGDPSLCIFGERVTPNQHRMVKDFVLLDNTYCSGILSADGHQWSTTAFSTDYMEKSFAGSPQLPGRHG